MATVISSARKRSATFHDRIRSVLNDLGYETEIHFSPSYQNNVIVNLPSLGAAVDVAEKLSKRVSNLGVSIHVENMDHANRIALELEI